MMNNKKQIELKRKAKLKITRKKYYENNRKKIKIMCKNWIKSHPWYSHYSNSYQRCNNPNTKNYSSYGGKGVKLLMSPDDFKFLWFRDKAYDLKRPSIDRKDSNGHYELSNCRFIEVSLNSKLANNFTRRGEKCHLSKLTEKQVLKIRKLYKTKRIHYKKLAPKFQVHPETIRRIIKRDIWKHTK